MSKILNVLIVEDAPVTRVFLKRVVLSHGHHIVAMPSNGKDALQAIKAYDIDLILMDINIDGPIDGIKVIKMMQSKNNPTVYFISAYSDMETVNEALSTNAHNYIIKPIKESDISIALTVTQNVLDAPQSSHIMTLSSNLSYDKKTKEIYENNQSISLTKLEKLFIDLFVLNINTNITHENILNSVWEGKEISDSTIRSTLSSLRKKLPTLNIETNIGRGYILKRID